MGGDSSDYISLGERMTLSECFYEPTEKRPLDPRNMDDRRIIISGRHKIGKCFFFMHRPFLLPFLLKVFDLEGFNVFQNLLKVLAWVSFSFSVFLLNFRGTTKLFLHATILFSYFNTLNYNNFILSEDTTLSFWVLSFAIFIKILGKPNPEKEIDFLLSGLNICIFSLVFIRDSNFTLASAYLCFVYIYLQIYLPKKSKFLLKRSIYLHLFTSVFILTASSYSLNYSYRYEWTFRMNMDYNLGQEYWPSKVTSNVYIQGDRNWFFENYPEIKNLGVDTTDYLIWQTKNIKKVWLHYVGTHLPFFLKIAYYNFKGHIYHSVAAFFLVFSIFVLVLNFKKNPQGIFLFSSIFIVVFLDYFIALIGDAPGSLQRHANVSHKLSKVSFDLLYCFGLLSLIQVLEAIPFFFNKVQTRISNSKNWFCSFSNLPVFPVNIILKKTMLFLKSKNIKILVPRITEAIGIIFIATLSWGSIIGDYYYDRGISQYYSKNYQRQIEDMEVAIFFGRFLNRHQNIIANRFHWKAVGFTHLKQYDRALDHYAKSIDADASFWENYEHRGNIYANTNQYQLAIEEFSKAINYRPD
ncbi:MAG: tetratricopeptide repeat protein, partial [Nitrospinae bacterium]|nr:tetratricopeptide repeat protein [Nitrospinota bacterium]